MYSTICVEWAADHFVGLRLVHFSRRYARKTIITYIHCDFIPSDLDL